MNSQLFLNNVKQTTYSDNARYMLDMKLNQTDISDNSLFRNEADAESDQARVHIYTVSFALRYDLSECLYVCQLLKQMMKCSDFARSIWHVVEYVMTKIQPESSRVFTVYGKSQMHSESFPNQCPANHRFLKQ